MRFLSKVNYFRLVLAIGFLMMAVTMSVAEAAQSLGQVADTVIDSFENLVKLITAAAYIAGIGFSIGAVMKFKQHKDNPTQIPIGTPIALVFISAALLFLPSIIGVTGQTIFAGNQTSAGYEGVATFDTN